MSQRVIHRPARVRATEPVHESIDLIPPPNLPDAGAGVQGVMQILMPIMGGAGSIVMIVANKNPIMLIAGGIMLIATVLGAVIMFVAQRTGAGKKATDLRRRYLDYLDGVRVKLATAGQEQRTWAVHQHPHPTTLPDIARDPLRLWERRPRDPDFLTVRVGLGGAPLWHRVEALASRDPLSEPDAITAAAVHRVVERQRSVEGVPVAVPISGRVALIGEPAHTHPVALAMLAQLLTLHGPEEVTVVTCVPRQAAAWLGWLKWMPHCLSPDEVDGTAPRRLIAETVAELGALVGPELARRGELLRNRMVSRGDPSRLGPAVVMLIETGPGPAPDPFVGLPDEARPELIGMHAITLCRTQADEPGDVSVRVLCRGGGVQVQDLREPTDDRLTEARRRALGADRGQVDVIDGGLLRGLVRELTAVRLVEESAAAAPLEATLDLTDLVGVQDVADFDPIQSWAPRAMPDFLRMPFGLGPAGEKVYLDIKEPALGGMGPHGLCVGATGSGKSEVLRTIVLTMAIAHPPERLALVLVDYKGGATFAGLEDLPHCSAMISNLSDDNGLVDRLHDALFGEMKRRQQLLADAGNLPNITEYNRHRDAGENLLPLPNLFVVIDEFGELLTAKPDFIELFLAIGRIGRSIGVHLMLASQRLEEGRLRGLESFLSYRLGLRTFNAGESRNVLGVPDAYELPPIPGSGYLKVDTTVFQRFKAGYVSGPYRPPVTGETVIDTVPIAAPFPLFNDTAAYLAALGDDAPPPVTLDDDALAPSVLDAAVRRLAKFGDRTAQIWLPPLPTALALDTVAGPVAVEPVAGLRAAGPGGRLKVAVGLLDRPAEQKQEPLVLDLAGSGGHLAILGAPQSGKSVFLRTLIVSAALTHLPGEVSFYCLDLGGGSLRVLEGLPHVAGVAPRLDADRVRRTVAEVASAVAEREELFNRLGIDSVDIMRERFRGGRLPQLDVADIFLVVDNYPVLRSDFEDLSDLVQDLATRGPGYGVHIILTSGRWADIRMQLQAAIGTKLEFRLNDPADSSIGRKPAANLRADTPGRCILEGGLQTQVCLPVLAADLPALAPAVDAAPVEGVGPVETLIENIRTAWAGPPVPPIRMLPTLVPVAELRAQAGTRKGVVIGVDEVDLGPVEVDLFGNESHLLLVGDAESGKTSFLRLLVADLTARFTDSEVVFAVFDVRRTLLDIVPEDYLGAYAGTAAVAAATAQAIAGELAKRLPPDDVTAAQLRARSWWKGPEIVVVADDYDLLSPGGAGPLAPFVEYLPQARDLGFHMVLSRRSGGVARALYEPLLQRLREVGATGVLLSGDRQEGAIYPGVQLSVQPPGRARLVRRGRKPALVQLAFQPDPTLD